MSYFNHPFTFILFFIVVISIVTSFMSEAIVVVTSIFTVFISRFMIVISRFVIRLFLLDFNFRSE